MDILNKPLAIVDVETTGMNYRIGGVIEIAILRVENRKIVKTYSSLVNPGTGVSPFITKLTGISSKDLMTAPKFSEIANEVYDLLHGAILVAHNARFDYLFIKSELNRLGYEFSSKQLCTVKLSRALYPVYKSHKLASIIERHDLKYNVRHRAFDDASVVWQFLEKINNDFSAETINSALKQQLGHPSLPKNLPKLVVSNLPESPGVYIFKDELNTPLYIGKSINIKKRVLSHFTGDGTKYREFKISQNIYDIEHHKTAGELEALLLESQLIKELKPVFNKKLRRKKQLVVTKKFTNPDGYSAIKLETLSTLDSSRFSSILTTHETRFNAKSSLIDTIKSFELCPKLSGLEKSKKACFHYQLGKCRGACIKNESPESYNDRVQAAFKQKSIEKWPFDTPIVINEPSVETNSVTSFIVDKWCIIGKIIHNHNLKPYYVSYDASFDLDSYKILRTFVNNPLKDIHVRPATNEELGLL